MDIYVRVSSAQVVPLQMTVLYKICMYICIPSICPLVAISFYHIHSFIIAVKKSFSCNCWDNKIVDVQGLCFPVGMSGKRECWYYMESGIWIANVLNLSFPLCNLRLTLMCFDHVRNIAPKSRQNLVWLVTFIRILRSLSLKLAFVTCSIHANLLDSRECREPLTEVRSLINLGTFGLFKIPQNYPYTGQAVKPFHTVM